MGDLIRIKDYKKRIKKTRFVLTKAKLLELLSKYGSWRKKKKDDEKK